MLHSRPGMAEQDIHPGIREFTLVSPDGGTAASVIPALGGIVSSLRFGTRECLFRHPWFRDSAATETRGGMPVLFPICGRLLKDGVPGLYFVDGKPFALPIHGFAMRLPWEVADASRPGELRLRLADSSHTRALYPFPFELELLFSVARAEFSCQLTVRNPGPASLPYYAGFHPYFLTPPPGAGKEQTRFEAHATARQLYNETKTDVTGTAAPPAFPLACTDPGINDLLLETGPENTTRLVFPDGFVLRQTASGLFRFRQLYTLPNEPFFCDEPWMAPAGAMNRAGAARRLPPGQSESGTIQIAAAGA